MFVINIRTYIQNLVEYIVMQCVLILITLENSVPLVVSCYVDHAPLVFSCYAGR